MKYSVIIPVYNRPDHIQSLLECFTRQSFKDFEVIVVESGSSIKADKVVESFSSVLNVQYIYKSNEGQGFSRNKGMQNAKGEFFIILDSDILLPDNYLQAIEDFRNKNNIDAFGGPDKLHPASTLFQKAVNFCMTSMLTTGGTRGKKNSVGKYLPRSFNMGVSRKVFEKTKGYNIPFLGEDLEWSMRIIGEGFKSSLIEDAYVMHERKKDFNGFWKQIVFFGRARINLLTLIDKSFKIIHLLPIIWLLYLVFSVLTLTIYNTIFSKILVIPLAIYLILIFIIATFAYRNIIVGYYSLLLTFVLMAAYSFGMIKEYFKLFILKQKQEYLINESTYTSRGIRD